MPPELLPSLPEHASQLKSRKALAPNIKLDPVTSHTVPAYRRLITTILPISYSDKFYKDSIANPTSSSLALCAQWQDSSISYHDDHKLSNQHDVIASKSASPRSLVVGGIQCRLEPIPIPPTTSSPSQPQQALYIQTLAVLSPYRCLGIATSLLDTVVTTALTHYSSSSAGGCVAEVYAHVWEANTDALEWYRKRGFVIEEEVVESYYRKLRPGGARVVRRRVGVGDWLRVERVREGEEGVKGLVEGGNQIE
ncbi:hypothetical protein ACLMJK_001060 [Lecanora helva]